MICVVSNSSPLIGLSSISCLGLLRDIWSRIHIPSAVYDETVSDAGDRPGAREIGQACGQWIEVVTVGNTAEVDALKAVLDAGEAEAIALGQEKQAAYILLDNREPRFFARSIGLRPIGALGILALGYHKGLCAHPIAKAHELRARGFWVSDVIMRRFENGISLDTPNK